MKTTWAAHLLFSLCILAIPNLAVAQSDENIKRAIIQQSISSYPGNCPCPYNTDRAGRKCGARSAYSRAGGYETICYPDDVTEAMMSAYRTQNQLDEEY